MNDTTFAHNVARSNSNKRARGGALYMNNGLFELNNCVFDNCVAQALGSQRGQGGALCLNSMSGMCYVTGCTIVNCGAFAPNSRGAGGGILLFRSSSLLTITATTISRCRADGFGGGIGMTNGRLFLQVTRRREVAGSQRSHGLRVVLHGSALTEA